MGRGGEAGEGSRHTASLHAAWMPRAREEPQSSPDHAPGDGAGRPIPASIKRSRTRAPARGLSPPAWLPRRRGRHVCRLSRKRAPCSPFRLSLARFPPGRWRAAGTSGWAGETGRQGPARREPGRAWFCRPLWPRRPAVRADPKSL